MLLHHFHAMLYTPIDNWGSSVKLATSFSALYELWSYLPWRNIKPTMLVIEASHSYGIETSRQLLHILENMSRPPWWCKCLMNGFKRFHDDLPHWCNSTGYMHTFGCLWFGKSKTVVFFVLEKDRRLPCKSISEYTLVNSKNFIYVIWQGTVTICWQN